MSSFFETHFIFKYKRIIVLALLITTGILLFNVLKLEKGYQYFSVLPRENKIYKDFEEYKSTFKDNQNVVSIGIAYDSFFKKNFFNNYRKLHYQLKNLIGVENVLSIVNISVAENNTRTQQFDFTKPFDTIFYSQSKLDSLERKLRTLKLYEGSIFYKNNLMLLVYITDSIAQSKMRDNVLVNIEKALLSFKLSNHIDHIYVSGLPFIRTQIARLISKELTFLAVISSIFLLCAIFLFYRNWQDVLVSFVIILMGIVWSMGSIHLLGYKLSLLTAVVPTIIIIIGIPNCIYFLNKYHFYLAEEQNKSIAIRKMLDSMGKTTLFCNITMALGFFVFMFTNSPFLYEFGLVAGMNIALKFVISYLAIPLLLYYLPSPKSHNSIGRLSQKLDSFTEIFYNFLLLRKKLLLLISIIIALILGIGIFRVKPLTYVLDDIPNSSSLRSDLKYFENNFKGIFSLEIVINTKKRKSIFKDIARLENIEQMIIEIERFNNTRSLSIINGLKGIRQAYYFQDSNYFQLPNAFDASFIIDQLKTKTKQNDLSNVLNSFVDSMQQKIRISVRVRDMGSIEMQKYIDTINHIVKKYALKENFSYTFSGAMPTFLEGNVFIMNGLKESIIWSIVLITLCLIYLFKSIKIVLVSLLPNIIPLILCYGIMGFVGLYLKPATVIVFSIALGIAADITIRYLISFKKIQNQYSNHSTEQINLLTLRETFSSILFTSIALIIGFLIFIFSSFENIRTLGWLTSLTLLIATIYNLIFLPLMINLVLKSKP